MLLMTCLGAQAIINPGSYVASTVLVALIGFRVTSFTVTAVTMV